MDLGTFRIWEEPRGVRAVDACTFNRWPRSPLYPTRALAELWAAQAHAFKIGRRITGPDAPELAQFIEP